MKMQIFENVLKSFCDSMTRKKMLEKKLEKIPIQLCYSEFHKKLASNLEIILPRIDLYVKYSEAEKIVLKTFVEIVPGHFDQLIVEVEAFRIFMRFIIIFIIK